MATISLAGLQLDPNNQFVTSFIANEAVVGGVVVYLDTDGEVNKAINTDSAKDDVVGIVIQDADALNQCGVITQGIIQVSNTLVIGDSYILAAVAGDIMLATDILSTHFLTWVAGVVATNKLELSLKTFSAQKA